MSLKLTFQIFFQSDYHVGAGHGLGTEIDSALLRDADGVLALRGTLLSGLLREGLVELLDQKSMQRWRDAHPCQSGGVSTVPNRFCGQYEGEGMNLLDMCPVCRIFGSPRWTKRWSFGSARPKEQARVGAEALHPTDINSRRVMRARVNPRTRRAEPRKLFSQEHGGQQVFQFAVECPADDEAALDEAALLVAAARMVRQLGRGRRRGLGECLIKLTGTGFEPGIVDVEKPQAWLLKRFQERWLEGRAEDLASPEPAVLTASRRREGQKVRVRVIAHADEPLLIAERASAGNQFETQSAIPGKTLRGALAARAVGAFDLDENATRLAFVDLFLRGTVRFPTLYPMQFDEKGTLFSSIPVPRDGYICKVYPSHGIQWGTLGIRDENGPDQVCQTLMSGGEEPERLCGREVKAVRGQFVTLSAEDQKPFVPRRRNEMHIQIDRDTGRVERGQVFEYVALEAGQYFAGEIVCKDANAWSILQEFLGIGPDAAGRRIITVHLGKGRQRGYGQVTLWFTETGEQSPLWIGRPLKGDAGRVVGGQYEVTLTLLTDAIVADSWGRFATGFGSGWLADVLKVEVDQIQVMAAYAATQVVDGFNSIQQLPRWRDLALAAGSSVRMRVTGLPNGELYEKLEKAEKEGIGLRRNEGYGQVAFEHPVYAGCQGVQNVSVGRLKLPHSLRPGTAKRDARADFQREWSKSVRGEKWDVCARSSSLQGAFAALARWLVVQQAQSPDDLAKVLDVLLAENEQQREAAKAAIPEALANTLPALGEPDDCLKTKVIQDYGARDKGNKLTQQDARDGVKLIQGKLTYLARQSNWRPFWAEGVAMIAAQIAEVTKGRGEGE